MKETKGRRSRFTLLAAIFLALHPILYFCTHVPIKLYEGHIQELTRTEILLELPFYEVIISLMLWVAAILFLVQYLSPRPFIYRITYYLVGATGMVYVMVTLVDYIVYMVVMHDEHTELFESDFFTYLLHYFVGEHTSIVHWLPTILIAVVAIFSLSHVMTKEKSRLWVIPVTYSAVHVVFNVLCVGIFLPLILYYTRPELNINVTDYLHIIPLLCSSLYTLARAFMGLSISHAAKNSVYVDNGEPVEPVAAVEVKTEEDVDVLPLPEDDASEEEEPAPIAEETEEVAEPEETAQTDTLPVAERDMTEQERTYEPEPVVEEADDDGDLMPIEEADYEKEPEDGDVEPQPIGGEAVEEEVVEEIAEETVEEIVEEPEAVAEEVTEEVTEEATEEAVEVTEDERAQTETESEPDSEEQPTDGDEAEKKMEDKN